MSKIAVQSNVIVPSRIESRYCLEQLETFGTLVEKAPGIEGIYSLDTLVENENNRYWLRMIGLAIDEPDRERFLDNLKEYSRQREIWTSTRTTKAHLVGTHRLSLQASVAEPASIDWRYDPSGILERLNPTFAENHQRRMAVLFAETIDFRDGQQRQLLDYLGDFIAKNRFTNDVDTLTIVGAAIRKFAMSMTEGDFQAYAEWLRPTETESLSPHTELELAKALAWRLVYENVAEGKALSELILALSSLAGDYLFAPRRVLQENYASIALNAILAVAVLEAFCREERMTSELLGKVEKLHITWFSELLARRIGDAAIEIESRDVVVAERLRNMLVAAN